MSALPIEVTDTPAAVPNLLEDTTYYLENQGAALVYYSTAVVAGAPANQNAAGFHIPPGGVGRYAKLSAGQSLYLWVQGEGQKSPSGLRCRCALMSVGTRPGGGSGGAMRTIYAGGYIDVVLDGAQVAGATQIPLRDATGIQVGDYLGASIPARRHGAASNRGRGR